MHTHSPSWFMLSSQATAHIHYDALLPAVLCTALALVIVGLRWYSRMMSRKGSVGTEDWMVTLAMLLSVAFTALIGGEFHTPSPRITLRLIFAQSLLYHLSTNLIKASFCIQYLRLFSLVRPVAWACIVLQVAILGAAAWGVFGVVFLCDPVHRYWDVREGVGECGDAQRHFLTTGVVGVGLDWVIWILPIPVVGRLKLPRRQKAGLLGVFGLGGVVCIVSILRLVLVYHFAREGKVTKSGTFALIWSTLELNVAIICASLLVMKPLFARFIPAMVSEQPVSAAEDARVWRAMTGLSLLDEAVLESEGKKQEDVERGRRDTAVAMSIRRGSLAVPASVWKGRKKSGGRARWSW
ncbi:hypothetical protein CC86DRAFT_292356 [Ophiobolus disseminans]|uniref:Rhodopsin domain-containing protein n=1 Tax=Ophiobolus disseminans TaxID=1469910 RepID=A0A6A6ZZX4_9PLEO|nr:hypothetical protein CC86DRAFT_292356 [Ophiobolus disseminans]